MNKHAVLVVTAVYNAVILNKLAVSAKGVIALCIAECGSAFVYAVSGYVAGYICYNLTFGVHIVNISVVNKQSLMNKYAVLVIVTVYYAVILSELAVCSEGVIALLVAECRCAFVDAVSCYVTGYVCYNLTLGISVINIAVVNKQSLMNKHAVLVIVTVNNAVIPNELAVCSEGVVALCVAECGCAFVNAVGGYVTGDVCYNLTLGVSVVNIAVINKQSLMNKRAVFIIVTVNNAAILNELAVSTKCVVALCIAERGSALVDAVSGYVAGDVGYDHTLSVSVVNIAFVNKQSLMNLYTVLIVVTIIYSAL